VSEARTIILQEYQTARLMKEELPESLGERLWKEYDGKITVDFPTVKTGYKWCLTAQGWVGQIPLTSHFGIRIKPKVPIENVFRMLEFAYGLKGFHFLEGFTDLGSLDDVYERLANVLARRIMDRARKGLYRNYDPRSEPLSFVRERMDVSYAVRHPWRVKPWCDYHIHTPDVDDNRILAWTLHVLRRSGIRREEVRRSVAGAHRIMNGAASPVRFSASDCVGRLYTRLNDDYRVLHALCRFILEHTGPNLTIGPRTMLPFLIPMAQLFESFVAAWLKENLPADITLREQDHVSFSNETYFKIDLVLYQRDPDSAGEKALCVMDTKYKTPEGASADDIAQVVSYAVSKRCLDAYLIYPTEISKPLDIHVGDVHVQSLAFRIDGDLEVAGREMLESLGIPISEAQ
jgi:5-methylcytosine-specific restriction enzyme subunit McrC